MGRIRCRPDRVYCPRQPQVYLTGTLRVGIAPVFPDVGWRNSGAVPPAPSAVPSQSAREADEQYPSDRSLEVFEAPVEGQFLKWRVYSSGDGPGVRSEGIAHRAADPQVKALALAADELRLPWPSSILQLLAQWQQITHSP